MRKLYRMKRLFYLITALILSQISFGNELPYFITDPIENLTEFDLYYYQIIATDPDSEDSLRYFVKEKPDWLYFTDYGNDTALLMGSPDQFYESNLVIIYVTDGKDTVLQEFNINILCLNCGPEIITEPITQVIVDSQYICNIYGTDCSGNVVFTADSLPNWLSSDNSELNMIQLTGIPSLSDTGSHYVSLYAEREISIFHSIDYLIFTIDVITSFQNNVSSELYILASFYPNPSTGSITIINNDILSQYTTLEILDINGKTLFHKILDNTNNKEILDLGFLISGIYYLRFSNDIESSVQKIIIVAH
jgi:hypothetical protein